MDHGQNPKLRYFFIFTVAFLLFLDPVVHSLTHLTLPKISMKSCCKNTRKNATSGSTNDQKKQTYQTVREVKCL